MVRQGENDGWNLVIFTYITANKAVISNSRDNRTLTKGNLVYDGFKFRSRQIQLKM